MKGEESYPGRVNPRGDKELAEFSKVLIEERSDEKQGWRPREGLWILTKNLDLF